MAMAQGRLTRVVRIGVGALLVVGGLVATSAIASATTPSISVSSSSAPAGSQIGISGGGWAPYDGVQVRLTNASGTYLCSVSANSAGTIVSQNCTVPTSVPDGSYGLYAQDSASTPLSATAPFTLTPGIFVENGSTPIASANSGQTVNLVGVGFAASTAVTAKVNGSAVTLSPSTITAANGSFTGTTFTVPTLTAGDYPVTVTDGTHTGTTTLEVYAATLSAPIGEPAGSLLPISGTGWPALDSIQIRYYQGISNLYDCTVYSDVNQNIGSQTCSVPTSLPAGSYTLTASDGSVVATLPVTVTPGVEFYLAAGQPTDNVAVGETVSVVGWGFAAGSTVTATFKGKPLTLTPAVATSTSGAFAASTFVVPKETKAGLYPIKLTDGSSNAVTVNLFVYVAKLVAPASASANALLSVSGTGFPAYDSLQVRLYQGAGNTYLCTVYTDASGTLESQDCTVPNALPAGIYTLTLSDGYVSVSKPFSMVPNLVMIGATASTATGNAAVGQSVSLDGYGFSAGASLKATLGGASVSLSPKVTVGGNGQFSGTSFTVPSLTAGRYPLVVKDAAGKSATVSLRVFVPMLIAPSSVGAGQAIQISGTGFPHGDSLQVRVFVGTSNVYLCTIYSDAGGAIEPQDCTAPSTLPAGSNYTLTLSDGSISVSQTGFTITPSLVLVNSIGQPAVNVAPGSTLTLSGYGFAATSTVATVKVGSTSVTTTPSSPAISSSGSFSGVTFVVPSVAAGSYTVTVTDSHLPVDTGTVVLTVS